MIGPQIEDDTKIQFIILYAVFRADRVIKHSDISEIILNTCNITFTDFQIGLEHLVSINFLHKTTDDNEDFYKLTDDGRQSIKLFMGNISVNIRSSLNSFIPAYFNEEFIKNRVVARIEPINKQEYMALCSIYDDNDVTLLDLKFYAGSKEDAYNIQQNFKNNSDSIYSQIMNILIDKKDK